MVCVHSALKSNEPDICAINGVLPQQENKIPFLANCFAEVTTEQNVTTVSTCFFYPLAVLVFFLQLSKDIFSTCLKSNTF